MAFTTSSSCASARSAASLARGASSSAQRAASEVAHSCSGVRAPGTPGGTGQSTCLASIFLMLGSVGFFHFQVSSFDLMFLMYLYLLFPGVRLKMSKKHVAK